MMPLSASKLRSARRYRLVHDWALTEEEATQFIARFPVQHASRRQLQTDVQAVIAARMQPAADGDLEPEFIRMTLQPDWPKVKTERVDDDASPAVPRAMPSFPPPPMPPKDVLLKGRVESAREKTVRMARERSASSPASSSQAEPLSWPPPPPPRAFVEGSKEPEKKHSEPARKSVKEREEPPTQRWRREVKEGAEAKAERAALHEHSRAKAAEEVAKLAADRAYVNSLQP